MRDGALVYWLRTRRSLSSLCFKTPLQQHYPGLQGRFETEHGPSLLKTGIGFMSDDIEHGLGGASKLHQSGLALESIAGAEIGFPGQLELDLVFGNRIR